MADEEENEGAAPAGDAVNAAGGSKKKLLLIGIILFVLVAGGAVGGYLFLSQGSNDQEPVVVAPEGAAGEAVSPEVGAEEKKKKVEGEETKEGGEKKKTEGGKAEDAIEDEGKKIDTFGMGRTIAFKPFHLNLGNPLENHYVRLEVSIEVGENQKAEQELERRKAQLRDAIVSIVSHKTREFLLNPDGKEQLRSEILRRVNRYMKNKVNQVFITDILIE